MNTQDITKKKVIGLREFRENTDAFIKATQKGREYIVMRKNEPAFKVGPVDEWGDEGVWETVVDFTEFYVGGISADELGKIFDKVREEKE